ncbi:PhoP/PhoQ regulator MgrB [Xenorhabdus mauleonii]|nr:PhoP/PhoQ regulator MgrB [Xenorhabdus mauleonii]
MLALSEHCWYDNKEFESGACLITQYLPF